MARHVARVVDDHVPVAALQRVEPAVAIAEQRLDARRRLRLALAAIEERHRVAARQRLADEVRADEPGAAEDQDAQRAVAGGFTGDAAREARGNWQARPPTEKFAPVHGHRPGSITTERRRYAARARAARRTAAPPTRPRAARAPAIPRRSALPWFTSTSACCAEMPASPSRCPRQPQRSISHAADSLLRPSPAGYTGACGCSARIRAGQRGIDDRILEEAAGVADHGRIRQLAATQPAHRIGHLPRRRIRGRRPARRVPRAHRRSRAAAGGAAGGTRRR